MNSGVRLSVAIIILVIVLVGLYYASLDDGAGELASSTGTPVESMPEPPSAAGIATEPASDSGPVAELDVEPAVVVEEVVVAIPPTSPPANDLIDDPAAGRPEDESGESVEESTLEPSNLADEAPASEEFAEFDLERSDAQPSAASSADPTDPEDLSAASEEAPGPEGDPTADEESAERPPTDLDDARDSAPAEPREPASARKAGRVASATGVGMHRLPVEVDLSSAEREVAIARLADASDPDATSVVAGSFLAWVPLPDATSLGKAGSDVVTAQGPGERTWVLIREDLDGTLDLNGRISSAELNTVPSTGTYNILVRIDSDEVDTVVERSRALRTHPVAWVMDGRILRVTRPRTVINGRGSIPLATDEATAELVAARLMMPPEELTVVPTPAEPTEDRVRVGRPAGPGELPATEYTSYTIEPGDTPSSIALWWFGDANKVSLVLKANPNMDPTRMLPGDVIRLPPKDYELWTVIATPVEGQRRIHIVQSGETLSHIAQAAYGNAGRWPEIYEANREVIGDDPTRLRLGMELVIP